MAVKRRSTDKLPLDDAQKFMYAELSDKIGRSEFKAEIVQLESKMDSRFDSLGTDLFGKIGSLTDKIDKFGVTTLTSGKDLWWRILVVLIPLATMSGALIIISINAKVDPVKTLLLAHYESGEIHQSSAEKMKTLVARDQFELYNELSERVHIERAKRLNNLEEIVRSFQLEMSGIVANQSAQIEEINRTVNNSIGVK